MQRRNPRAGIQATYEALPKQALTPDWYWACYRRWLECPTSELGLLDIPEFAEAVDTAVVDLVDKHGIVPPRDRDYLRSWLAGLYYQYFPTWEAIRNELTDKEAEKRKEKVGLLGKKLREELTLLYADELPPDILAQRHPGILALKRLVSHAQQERPFRDRPTAKDNASKDVVHVLSKNICWFWMHSHGCAVDIPFDFSTGSQCFRFAKYVYACVGASCSDPMIVKRLRTAHGIVASEERGGTADPTRRFPLMLAPRKSEQHGPYPFPIAAQHMLRVLLDAGGVGFLDEPNHRIIAGTPSRPGRVVPGSALDLWLLVPMGLIAGERGLLILRHAGRTLARHGRVGDNSFITDVDLPAWGRAEMEYLEAELLHAVELNYAEFVSTRLGVLQLLLQKGVITAAEARKDV